MKGTTIFVILCLVGAVAFYRVNALISMMCFLMLVGVAFSAGRLG
jgi:hypothetical protein